jgi:hypothetical protein
VKIFNAIGPWSGVIDGFAAAVYRRAVYVAQYRNLKQRRRDDPPPVGTVDANGVPLRRPFIGRGDEIIAPDPGA